MRKTLMGAVGIAAMLAPGGAAAAPLKLEFTGTTTRFSDAFGDFSDAFAEFGGDEPAGAAVTILYDSAAPPSSLVSGTRYNFDSMEIRLLNEFGATMETIFSVAGSEVYAGVDNGSFDTIQIRGRDLEISDALDHYELSFAVSSLDDAFSDEALSNLTEDFINNGTQVLPVAPLTFRVSRFFGVITFSFDSNSATLTDLSSPPALIPLPAGLPLMLSALAGLALLRRRG